MPGQLVSLSTRRMGGGEPLEQIFIVAEADPEKAIKLVMARSGATTDETLEAVQEIDDEALGHLALQANSGRIWAYTYVEIKD